MIHDTGRNQMITSLTLPGDHLASCWACHTTYQATITGRQWDSMHAYEAAVEAIEALPFDETFTRGSIWRTIDHGPTGYQAIGRAIRDLQLHRLIVCARRHRNRCAAYRRIA